MVRDFKEALLLFCKQTLDPVLPMLKRIPGCIQLHVMHNVISVLFIPQWCLWIQSR